MKNRILLSILIAGFLFSCSSKKVVKEEDVKPVKYALIGEKGATFAKSFSGISKSGSETKLSFRTNGLVAFKSVKIGQKVTKGEILAELDLKDLLLQYEQAKASLLSSKIAMETAASNLSRVKQLYQSNNASLSEYEDARNSYASAESQHKLNDKSLSLKKLQIDYARIIAPINGVVSEVKISENEFAQAGSPVITVDSKDKDFEIELGVPESYITKIVAGEKTKVNFTSITDQIFTGIITEVGYSKGETLTYPVKVKLEDASDQIRPGMPCYVTFSLQSDRDGKTVLVPVKAVAEDVKGTYVFVLEKMEGSENYKARKKYITVGKLSQVGFELQSGLDSGTKVAIAGLRSLFDGRIVSLSEEL